MKGLQHPVQYYIIWW